MSIPSGTPFPQQPAVDMVDVNGVRVASATGTVVASVNSGSGTLTGTTSVPAAAGRAQFTNLAITLPGGATVPVDHTLKFSRSGLPDVISNVINIRPADAVAPPPASPTATRVAFVSVPSTVAESATLTGVQVRAESALGLVATGYTGTITLSVETVTYVSSTQRDITLRASAPGLTAAISPSIRVTLT